MRKKHAYNLSHLHSLTCDMGYLVPCCLFDVLPNDTISMSTKAFIRVQPMLAPIMHEISVITQTWYVPYRLLWSEWETFITGGESGSEDLILTFPTIKAPTDKGFAIGSLADYFGYPVNQPDIEVSALPHRAYAMIYNERYRDEDLIDEVPLSLDSGLDSTTSLDLLRPAWKRDFATTARPWTQRGTEVGVPILQGLNQGNSIIPVDFIVTLNAMAPGFIDLDATLDFVVGVPNIDAFTLNTYTISFELRYDNDHRPTYTIPSGPLKGVVVSLNNPSMPIHKLWNLTLTIRPNLNEVESTDSPSSSVAVSLPVNCRGVSSSSTVIKFVKSVYTGGVINIRELRNASAIQRYEENSAKWGNRYEEYVQRSFGISPRDARVQRPEFVGSSKGSLTFSEVLQTAEGDQTQVGSMYGHGVGGISQKKCVLKVPEHGLVMTLLSIRPKSVYSQGIMRAWLKRTKFEFFTPELAHIGMQEVYQQEIFANRDNKGIVFGYQDRNYEYKSILPKVCGEFRGNLDFWNMARKFEQPPVLNSDFITMNPTKRIFGVTDQSAHSLLCMVRNDITARRVVPKSTESKLM